jgi:FkbM family methyltransferase
LIAILAGLCKLTPAGQPNTVNIPTKIIRTLCIRDYRAALLRHRVFASSEHDHTIDGLELDTIVDIGANRGQFALCVRRLYPKAKIYSFEPLQRPAAVYRRVFKNDNRVELFNTAIAATSGSIDMHVSKWDVSSSLLPFAQAQHDNFPFTEESRLETVTLGRLAESLNARSIEGRALLKLDVQGFELTALQGCEELLSRFQFVYIEASFIELYVGQALANEVIEYLQSKGYKLICVANLSFGKSRRPIQADFLFSQS